MRLRLLMVCAGVLALSACVTETKGYQPAKPNLPEAAKVNTELGSDYARQGLYDTALKKLTLAIEEDDSYAPAHARIAYVYAQQGDPAQAQREYRRALELDPNDPDTHNDYGVFLCAQGKTGEADGNFMQAAQNHSYSTPAAAWTNAGVCARKAGDLRRAEADFRQALDLGGDTPDPLALAGMAEINYGRQDYLHARAFLERYDKVGTPTPRLLVLGVYNERALGDEDAAHQYELKLLRLFPESNEAAQLTRQTSTSQ
jgi:type IV pilus assembly protein PilF